MFIYTVEDILCLLILAVIGIILLCYIVKEIAVSCWQSVKSLLTGGRKKPKKLGG